MGVVQVNRRRLISSLVVSVGWHTVTSTGAERLQGGGASTLVVQSSGPASTDGPASTNNPERKNERSSTGGNSSERKLRTSAKCGQSHA